MTSEDPESSMDPDQVQDSEQKQNRNSVFQVDDYPPWHIILLGAFQQVLANLYGPLSVVFIIHSNLCDPDNDLLFAELLSSAIFMSGICTLIQVTFGVRLPIVQNSSHSFLTPVIAMMATPQWRCPDLPTLNGTFGINSTAPTLTGEDLWKPRLLAISGSLSSAACFQVFLGCSGLLGFIMNYVGPMTIIPTVALIGLSLFPSATDGAEHQWGIACMVVGLIILFSLILSKVQIPFPAYNKKSGCHKTTYPFFKLFPHLLVVGLSWLLCYILTITDVFPSDPSALTYKARTDAKGDVIAKAKWFFWPYPGQFGTPTFSAGVFVGLFGTTISTIVESVSDYYMTASICNVPPPPKHAINRGIAIEGLGTIFCGLVGTGHSTTSYSGTVGFIGLTGIQSRIVWQVFGVLMIILGVIGKIGAALSTIPEPIIGGVTVTSLGMVFAIAIANVRHIDTSSSRNLLILAVCVMLGMMVPTWLKENPGIIQTGNAEADQVVTVLLSTNMFVGGVLAAILDNIVPGTREERGLTSFLAGHTQTSKALDDGSSMHSGSSVDSVSPQTAAVRRAYDIPFVSDALRRVQCCARVPFLPSYDGQMRCRCGHHKGKEGSVKSMEDSIVVPNGKLSSPYQDAGDMPVQIQSFGDINDGKGSLATYM